MTDPNFLEVISFEILYKNQTKSDSIVSLDEEHSAAGNPLH